MSEFSSLIKESLTAPHPPESFSFFDTPARSHLLNLLLQLVPHAPGLILVQGEPGSGKTTLLRRLKDSLQHDWSVVAIEKFNDTAAVMQTIVRGFGLDDRLASNDESNAEQIFLEYLKSAKFHSVLLFDDAQHFSTDFVARLKAWIQEAPAYPLTVVLFATPYASILDSLQFLAAHRFQVPLFTADETQGFLKLHMERNGSNVPSRMSRSAYEITKGNPGKIIGLIGEQKARVMPRYSRSLMMGVAGVIVLAGALMVLTNKDQSSNSNTVSSAAKTTLAERVEDKRPDSPRNEPAPSIKNDSTAATAIGQEENASSSAPPGSAVTPTTQQQQKIPASKAEPAEKTDSQKPKNAAPASDGPAVADNSRKAADPPVTAAPATAPTVTSTTGPRDENWLLTQSPELYTVQFAALKNRASIQKMIDGFKQKSQLAVYVLTRQSGELHALSYGLFKSQDEAEQAAKKLAPKFGGMKPWIRTLAAVHADIKKTQAARQPYP